MTHSVKIISLICLLTTSIAFSQKKWTLQECIAYAEEHNISVAQYELDFESTLVEKMDAIGNFLPSINASMSTSGNTGLALDPTTNTLVNTTILSASGNVGASMTVFDGLRNQNRLARAKLSELAAQYRLENLKDDIRLAVANNYLNVLSAKENFNVVQSSLEISRKDLEKTKQLNLSGVVPMGDVMEIEAQVAGQEQQLVNAANGVLIAKISLAQLLQITDYANFDVADEAFDVPMSDILNNSPKTIYNKALSFRSDIKLAEANVEIAEKDLQISKGARSPSVGTFFNYNTRYSDQNFNPISGELTPFKEQLWTNDGISYGAQMRIPIFSGFSVNNAIKRAKINVSRSQLQLKQQKLNLESSVNQAYADVGAFYKSFVAADKTLSARKTAFMYSKERFDVGLMNAFDFSQAQSRVDYAQAEFIRSKYNYIFRLKVLEYYFGVPLSIQ
jgi:outer membrane protein